MLKFLQKFKTGDVINSPNNYRQSDGCRAGNHTAIVLKDTGKTEFVETLLITHSTAGTNVPLDFKKLKSELWMPDATSQVTTDKFNSVRKNARKRKGVQYDI